MLRKNFSFTLEREKVPKHISFEKIRYSIFYRMSCKKSPEFLSMNENSQTQRLRYGDKYTPDHANDIFLLNSVTVT